MTKVAITTTLLDDLADAISAKTGEATPMSIDDMTDAVGAITLRSGTDLSASGATVTVPAGLYSAQATKSVASGSAGTPTATKGTVSNHAVSVTPSVTNRGGYISGGTKTGTAVSVSASELVSGNKAITSNGTNIDVADYATVSVSVSGGGGLELPMFSALYDNGAWTDEDCDTTYSDCAAYIADGLCGAVFDDQTTGLEYGGTGTIDSQTGLIIYNFFDDLGNPYVQVLYDSLGLAVTDWPTMGASDLAFSSGTVVIPSASWYAAGSKQMPSGSVSASATKGSVSNHAISVTPTATVGTAGYLAAGSTNGTAVSVSASELVSGTYTVDSSGTKDVTNYASASVPAGTAGTPSASKGTVSNHSVSVTPSVTNSTGWITGSTKTGTAVTVSASELVSGSETKTINGTYDVTNLAEIVVDVSGGGASVQVGYSYGYADAENPSTFSVVDLAGEPTSFVVYQTSEIATGTPAKVAAVVFDGTNLHGQTITNTSNAQVSADTGFTKSYSNGDLTITASTAQFAMNQPYYIVYTYGGTAACIDTEDVQVGSGATSITFTGLEDEPLYWSCIFKSNFGTSSGYQRVIYALEDADGVKGMSMDSSSKYSTSNFSATYSNGSLTISSSGTNAGGYFHQPGYYQLTYAIDATGNYQSKTITPTESQQVVQADSGYDALKKVTINAIPGTYVQPTSTVGSTTYHASTSSQTIQAGTYHSAAATIAAVSQTNLTAANIKNGTTITISNGQSNLWSVTGTYSGGGGGSASTDTKTVTASNRPSSLSFTSMKGEPIMWALRATFTMTSSSSTYYYVDSMRGIGTSSVQGRLFRMGSTRETQAVTTGYSASYSNGTFTVTSSGNRTTSPGCFYNGSYELVYAY